MHVTDLGILRDKTQICPGIPMKDGDFVVRIRSALCDIKKNVLSSTTNLGWQTDKGFAKQLNSPLLHTDLAISLEDASSNQLLRRLASWTKSSTPYPIGGAEARSELNAGMS